MLHKQSPRPGAFWAPRPGAGDMILPVQSPNRASSRTKKLPPPMTQTQKTARPRSDMLQGLLSFFMEKNHALPGCCGSTASAVTTMKRTVVCFP